MKYPPQFLIKCVAKNQEGLAMYYPHIYEGVLSYVARKLAKKIKTLCDFRCPIRKALQILFFLGSVGIADKVPIVKI